MKKMILAAAMVVSLMVPGCGKKSPDVPAVVEQVVPTVSDESEKTDEEVETVETDNSAEVVVEDMGYGISHVIDGDNSWFEADGNVFSESEGWMFTTVNRSVAVVDGFEEKEMGYLLKTDNSDYYVSVQEEENELHIVNGLVDGELDALKHNLSDIAEEEVYTVKDENGEFIKELEVDKVLDFHNLVNMLRMASAHDFCLMGVASLMDESGYDVSGKAYRDIADEFFNLNYDQQADILSREFSYAGSYDYAVGTDWAWTVDGYIDKDGNLVHSNLQGEPTAVLHKSIRTYVKMAFAILDKNAADAPYKSR